MSKTITLKEALCGFSFPVQHLDGRVLLVKTQPGEIIKPNTTKAIPGEGMPKHRNPFDKGALLIQFTIQMPETLPQATLDILSKVASRAPHGRGGGASPLDPLLPSPLCSSNALGGGGAHGYGNTARQVVASEKRQTTPATTSRTPSTPTIGHR